MILAAGTLTKLYAKNSTVFINSFAYLNVLSTSSEMQEVPAFLSGQRFGMKMNSSNSELQVFL